MRPRIGDEGHALLGGDEAGEDRRAGRVQQRDRAVAHGAVEARRAAGFAERHGARLEQPARVPAPIRRSTCRPPVGTQTRCRSRAPRAISGARRRHRDAGVIGRQRELRAGRDPRSELFEGDDLGHRRLGSQAVTTPFAARAVNKERPRPGLNPALTVNRAFDGLRLGAHAGPSSSWIS